MIGILFPFLKIQSCFPITKQANNKIWSFRFLWCLSSKGAGRLGLPTEQITRISFSVRPLDYSQLPQNHYMTLEGELETLVLSFPFLFQALPLIGMYKTMQIYWLARAGVTRGRIIPSNFDVHSGEHVMCIGLPIHSNHLQGT